MTYVYEGHGIANDYNNQRIFNFTFFTYTFDYNGTSANDTEETIEAVDCHEWLTEQFDTQTANAMLATLIEGPHLCPKVTGLDLNYKE